MAKFRLVKIVLYPFYDFTDSYISRPNDYCDDSSRIEEYSTLAMAQQKCSNNDQCNSITNYGDGGFWTCKDTVLLKDASGPCSWQKKHIGILIIFFPSTF